MGYKVTNPSAGVWHYEYALYNQNLDRAIQSFSVPLGLGANISNIGFHAPPQQPGWPHDGTLGDAGYSSTPWNVTQDASSITWSTETFATNQNANAIRYATLYNFRFDADQPPETTNATVGFFKTGSPMTVEIQAPAAGRNAYTDTNCHGHADCNTNRYTETDSITKVQSFAEASSNSATAPLALLPADRAEK